MGNLFLKKEKSRYCPTDKRSYEFKETTNGRFFVWKPKYCRSDGEVNSRYASEELKEKMGYGDGLHTYFNNMRLNEKMGTCFELGRTTYEYFLNREKKEREDLSTNTLEANRYKGEVAKNAEKHYKEDKDPYSWGAVINSNDWGHLYIQDMIEYSEKFIDSNGTEITYEREFFDNINFNKNEISELQKKIKKYFDSRDEELNEKYDELCRIEDSEELKTEFANIKMLLFLKDNADRMNKELKSVLSNKEKSYLDHGYNFRVGILTPNFKFRVEGFKYAD